MPLDVAPSASSSSNLMFSQQQQQGSSSRRGSKLSVTSANSWMSDNQPIPWENNNASSSSLRQPISSGQGHVHWHRHGHSSSQSIIVDHYQQQQQQQQTRSTMNGIAMSHAFSRSRVSMDALPAEEPAAAAGASSSYETSTDDRRISHYTITPSSSTASLPAMTDHPPAPPPFPGSIQAASVLGNGNPVGLGLPTFIGHTGRADWPVVCDIADDANESDDDEVHEMESYQAGHRAPVDAALRSMPGVVGLGDGWAGGPQPKPKRGLWLKRAKKESPATEADPLALWSSPVTPTAETYNAAASAGGAASVSANAPHHTTPLAASTDPNAKWWRSRKNLFSSQRNLASHAKQPPLAPSSNAGSKLRASRSFFGSMVDLGRSPRKDRDAAPESPSTPTQAHYSNKAKLQTPKRHTVATFLRKPPPHPLELTHGSNGSTAGAAARSQPVALSASSSQPSLAAGVNHHHPLLRQAYARSESHLAGGAQSPGIPPRPAPLIINSAPFVSTAQMPTWRQPRVSPTPLLEVEEEEEESEGSPESTQRPTLKRSATFGDDDEPPAQQQQQQHQHQQQCQHQAVKQPQASQAPSLPTVEGSLNGSPHETHRALSATPSVRGSIMTESSRQPPSLLGRIKNTLLGRGRNFRHDKSMSMPSPMIPESPRSVQSEQPQASTPTRASNLPPTRSIGRGLRTRSKLFRRRGSESTEPAPQFDLKMIQNRRKDSTATTATTMTSPAPKQGTYKLSKRVAESMINLSPDSEKSDTFGPTTGATISPHLGSRGRSNRSSWAAPIPSQHESDQEDNKGSTRRGSSISIGRFRTQSKGRPGLGTVFPKPPENVSQPPSLHWAFPGSYSTPMLHKFGGSTLSLALDISAEPGSTHLDDIEESPIRTNSRPLSPTTQRERALSATFAALQGQRSNVNLNEDIPLHLQPRRSVSVNVDNLANTSNDSLALHSNIIDFPLPPSSSGCSGELSSPDPDTMEHLHTPRDARQWPSPPELRTRLDTESTDPNLRKQPSWSTCKTSGTQLTPLATPTSVTHDVATREDSFTSLLNERNLERTPYMDKRASLAASITPQAHTPTQRGIVA